MVERYRSLFEPRHSHRNFPGGTRRIAALDGPIDQWFLRVVQHSHIFCPPFFGADARKEVWIERRRGGEREDFAVIWIHSHNHAASRRGSSQLIFGDKLQVEVDGGN